VTVVSLVLIVGAVILLGYGLLEGSNMYLVASILTSLVAALALVIGSRRSGRAAVVAAIEQEEAARVTRRRERQDNLVGAGVGGRRGGDYGDEFSDERIPPTDEYTDHDDLARSTRETTMLDVGRRGVPAQSSGGQNEAAYQSAGHDAGYQNDYQDEFDDEDVDDEFDEDPADEPPPQRVSQSEAARVAAMDADVLVIDGRPRYHLPGCVHLLGREHESLPVSEAVELGFSPCGLCEPDSTLLARARR
jgi:hypothetical protein